jgi:hypothetical protein
MSAFFVPGTTARGNEAERRYEQLRAAAAVGDAVAQRRRIFSLTCRHAGRDCTVEVGSPSPFDGSKVLAIFELGSRQGYRISTDSQAPDVQLGRHVYSVTEFA